MTSLTPGVLRTPVLRLLALACALLLVALLAGCGGSDDEGGASDDAAAATRTVKDFAGNAVEVPTKPQRVVVVNDELTDDALALGVKPVAISKGQGQDGPPRYLADRVAGVPIVGDVNQPDLDKVLDADPDLIIVSYDFPEGPLAGQVAKLRKIAPTFVASDPAKDEWKSTLRQVGVALNREAQAKDWLARYEQRTAQVGRSLGKHAGAEVTIARWNPDGPTFMHAGTFASTVVADLGLKRPKNQRTEGQGHGESLSLEALGELEADWIFLSSLTADGDDAKALEQGVGSKAFKQLDAVKAGHVSQVDGSVWGAAGGALASDVLIADVQKALGGGATR
ncbi:ABC transporter substrate-binding protein [Patulibacter sp. SYSU D01012]|uniref:ABC transporter substrate-binding protein n=1 Tax=Patulibacter sp. SYSU D01012 TaxID=2817381 RepID=UPI001B30DC30|nr:ABC transporter substrate-binding protein [Patulibacter sp. SYSU D01012]